MQVENEQSGDQFIDIPAFNLFKSSLLILFSLFFAVCLSLTFHEIGHSIAGLLMGSDRIVVHIHVFGLSYTQIYGDFSTKEHIFSNILGALFNILCSTIVLVLLIIKKPQRKYFPIMMWAPYTYLNEGIHIIQGTIDYNDTGLLNSDAARILYYSGVPPALTLIVGFVILFLGIIIINYLFFLLKLPHSSSFRYKLTLFVPAIIVFSTLSFLYIQFSSQHLADGGTLSYAFDEYVLQLIMQIILTSVIIWMYSPTYRLFNRFEFVELGTIDSKQIRLTSILAISIVPFEYLLDGLEFPNFIIGFVIYMFVIISLIQYFSNDVSL